MNSNKPVPPVQANNPEEIFTLISVRKGWLGCSMFSFASLHNASDVMDNILAKNQAAILYLWMDAMRNMPSEKFDSIVQSIPPREVMSSAEKLRQGFGCDC